MLFNEQGKKVTFPLKLAESKDEARIIYRLPKNKCLKVYSTPREKEVYDLLYRLRELDLASFYKIYSLLTDENNNFMGYTMEYYSKIKENLLLMSTDYLLDSMMKIYKDFLTLSNNHIITFDLHKNNIIKNNQGMYVIDADEFVYSDSIDSNEAKKENLNNLKLVFQEIIYDAILSYYTKPSEERGIAVKSNADLFKETPEEVSKKLVRCKYPIDYFKRRVG